MINVAPGAKIVTGQASRDLARDVNKYSKTLVEKYGSNRIGIFASLPDFQDVNGVLEEIDYCYKNISPDGFTVFTSYGESHEPKYIGHDNFDPIWEKLNEHNAIVFIHPCHAPSNIINQYAPQPVCKL